MVKPSDLIVLATIAGGGLAAAAIDVRTRRVPNALTASLAAAGVAFAVAGIGRLTIAGSIAGIVLGLGLMLPGHLFGATGAGDVKLFAAAGALLGPAATATAFLYTALAGGALAIAIACQRGRLQRTVQSTARLVATGAANAADIEAPGQNNRFPYAPAIAVGAVIAALGVTL
ncbi:MAG TPA: A24 family peptidase [Vicinamibacterales bacterium]|nr:A24 family peptidase [Vicinamibacterales bacterium]